MEERLIWVQGSDGSLHLTCVPTWITGSLLEKKGTLPSGALWFAYEY